MARSALPRRPGWTSISRPAPACTAAAVAYEADRAELRALRDKPPNRPATCGRGRRPRIERESGGYPATSASRAGRAGLPLGALPAWPSSLSLSASALVVAVVVPDADLGSPASRRCRRRTRRATRWHRPAGRGDAVRGRRRDIALVDPVGQHGQWLQSRSNGSATGRTRPPDCPAVNDTEPGRNAPVPDQHARSPTLAVFEDQAERRSPSTEPTSASQRLSVVALAPSPRHAATPPESAAATPPASATVSRRPTPTSTRAAAASPSRRRRRRLAKRPAREPSRDAHANAGPVALRRRPSPPLGDAAPVAHAVADDGRWRSPATSTSSASPRPFRRTATWFAFTARPSDGSGGPDIYVWQVGDAAAQRDHDGPRVVLRVVGC